jgi:hypothetical protein
MIIDYDQGPFLKIAISIPALIKTLYVLKPMSPLKAKYNILLIYLCISTIAGCATIEGKTITYHSEYQATVQASADALKNIKIPILEEVSDELRTEFLARRPDGTPVIVKVTRVDLNFTQVSVSIGAGVAQYLDTRVSDQIHGFIRGRLSHNVKD